jgi:hypothetical protein
MFIHGRSSNWFVSTAHTEPDIDAAIGRLADTMREVREQLV